MKSTTKFAVSFHFACLVGIIVILIYFKIIQIPGPIESLPLWDTLWYKKIRDNGYAFTAEDICNLAFFPLFPYFWKWSMLDTVGISILNVIILAVSVQFLLAKEKLSVHFKLCLISLPSMVFFFLPYSESFFFLFGALIIIGFRRDSNLLILIGLVGCGMVRSVALIFVPALILTEIICGIYGPKSLNKKDIYNLLARISTSLSSIAVVIAIQYYQTGKWLYFLTVQKQWGRILQIPELPFTTISPERIIGVDSAALVTGMIAIFFIIKWFYKAIKSYLTHKPALEEFVTREICFSVLYLAAITLTDVLFTVHVDNRTSLWSINRHLLCSPFFFVFVIWYRNNLKAMNDIEKTTVFLLIVAGVALSELINFPIGLAFYIFFTVIFFVPLWPEIFQTPKFTRPLRLIFYVFNIILFLDFFQAFLVGQWVG